MNIRLIHISDLHFAKITLNPLQFFSKRFIGNFNLLLNRRKHYSQAKLEDLKKKIIELKPNYVLISGDISTTSLEKEFQMGKDFVDTLKKENISCITIPGNHDHYTKQSYRNKLYYRFFSEKFDPSCPFSLKEDGLTFLSLNDEWTLVALDTALATAFYHSIGYFSNHVQQNLERVLSSFPKKQKLILMNHFPFFQSESPNRRLRRGDELKKIIEEHQNIKLYLHGHTHRHIIADLRSSHLPIILDSGSATHRKYGSWNLMDLSADQCKVQVYRFMQEAGGEWKSVHQKLFTW